jgi:hypothetical protein
MRKLTDKLLADLEMKDERGKPLYNHMQLARRYDLNIEDAKVRFYFEIDPKKHVPGAKRLDKTSCVIANAFRGQPGVLSAEIGAAITTLMFVDRVMRYRTPDVLRHGLNGFDANGKGEWLLARGVYYLNPPNQTYTLQAQRDREKQRNIIRSNKDKEANGHKGSKKKASINPRYIAGLKTKAATA